MVIPKRTDTPIAYISPLYALSIFPAPLFCATKADIACMKAAGTSMMKAQTFSATPTPADATSPSPFTMARITLLTMFSCSA